MAVRWAGVAVVLASSALVLSSCTLGGEPAAPSSAPPSSAAVSDPLPTRTDSPDPDPPPREGACRRVSATGLDSIVDDSPVVACRKRHTAETFFVGTLPKSATRGATTAGRARVERAADRICRTRFREHVGGDRADRRLTLLRPTYFLPASEQFALGARWVRCDVYAYATPDRLAALPRATKGFLSRERASAALDRCSPVSPSRREFRHVACRQAHRWRAVAVLPLGGRQEEYPGLRRAQNRAERRCESPVRRYLDTTDAFSYGFEVPRRDAWQAGDRLALCWARTNE